MNTIRNFDGVDYVLINESVRWFWNGDFYRFVARRSPARIIVLEFSCGFMGLQICRQVWGEDLPTTAPVPKAKAEACARVQAKAKSQIKV